MKLSKSMCWAVCSIAACLMVVDFATAQPPGGRGGGRGGQGFTRFQLATLAEVQGDLKLTDAQKKEATDAVAKAAEEQTNLRGAGGDFAETQAKLAKLRVELTDKFVALLDATQKSRINGLFVQANTANALGVVLQDALIAKELGFSDDQKKAIEKAATDTQTAARGAGRGDPEAAAKIRTDGDAALMKVLTDDQKTKLTALKGKELTMDTSSLGGRGGRGGGGGRGAGGGRRGADGADGPGRQGRGAGN